MANPVEPTEVPEQSLAPARPVAPPEHQEGKEGRKAQCKALNRRGEPCRSTSLGEDGLCSFHGGRSRLDAVEAGKASGKARREMGRSLRQRLADELEAESAQIVQVYKRALRSEDPKVALQALESWMTRVHGKPKERVEHVDLPTDPQAIMALSPEDLDALEAQLLSGT